MSTPGDAEARAALVRIAIATLIVNAAGVPALTPSQRALRATLAASRLGAEPSCQV